MKITRFFCVIFTFFFLLPSHLYPMSFLADKIQNTVHGSMEAAYNLSGSFFALSSTNRISIMKKKGNVARLCCESLDLMINEDVEQLYNVKYDNSIREYFLKSLEGPYIRTIDYCPWCGIKLPTSLRDKWYDTMDVLGIDPDLPEARKMIPEEFNTDKWWKKRGL